MNHLVFMSDGSRRLLNDQEFNLLASRDDAQHEAGKRFVATAVIDQDTFTAQIEVKDLATDDVVLNDPSTGNPWATKAAAESWVSSQNLSNPVVTYHGARNADIPRFNSVGEINPSTFEVSISVIDFATDDVVLNDPSTGNPWATKAAADAWAATQNANSPTIVDLYKQGAGA